MKGEMHMASIFSPEFDYENGFALVEVGRLAMYKTDGIGHVLEERNVLFQSLDTGEQMKFLASELEQRIKKNPDIGKILYSGENGLDVQIGNTDEYFRVRPLTSIVYKDEYERLKGSPRNLLNHPLLLPAAKK